MNLKNLTDKLYVILTKFQEYQRSVVILLNKC